MPARTHRPRPEGAGRRPAGPDGQPRDRATAFLVAEVEQEIVYAECARRGLPRSNAGVRQLLFDLLEEQNARALVAA